MIAIFRFVFFLFFLLSGCTQIHESVLHDFDGQVASQEDQEHVLQLLEERRELVSYYRALTRARFLQKEDSESFRYAFVYSVPERALRIEALPVHGAMSLSLFTTYQGQFTFLIPSEKKYYRGELTPQRLKQFFGIMASERDLMHLLIGALPSEMITYPSRGVELIKRKEDLLLRDSWGRFSALLDIKNGTLKVLEVRDRFRDQIVLRVHYPAYKEQDGALLPAKIIFELPHEDVKLSLDVQQIKLPEGSLPTSLFSIPLPGGYEDIELRKRS